MRKLPRKIDVEGIIERSSHRHLAQWSHVEDDTHIPPGSTHLIQVLHKRNYPAPRQLQIVRRRRPWTAEELTVVRDELIEGWGFWPAQPVEYGCDERRANLLTLMSADLYWVGNEMCDLIYSAMPSVEGDTLVSELNLPSDTGMVFLERPWKGGIDANTGEPNMIVDLFTWCRTLLGPEKERAVSIAAYRYLDFGALSEFDISLMGSIGLNDFLGAYLPHQTELLNGKAVEIMTAGHWGPLGRSDWPEEHMLCDTSAYLHEAYTGDEEAVSSDLLAGWEQSVIEDRQLLATFMALLQSERLATIGEHRPSRQVKRAAQRRGEAIPSPVKIVTLRRAAGPRSTRYEKPGRHVSHRFPVRAHHRNQAYGPRRELRKRILIAEHVRGPEDGPFIPKETVFKLVR